MGGPRDEVVAFRPSVAGITEVFHAFWKDHSYPAHTHSTWTVLVVDRGAIGYDLDRRHAQAPPRLGVTVLPPHVTHDGHPLTDAGFAKRVLYLDEDRLDASLVGPAVDGPLIEDRELRDEVSLTHGALTRHDDLEAETRLALVLERLTWHLSRRPERRRPAPAGGLAPMVRTRLDADPVGTDTLAAVAEELHVTVPHLVRTFSRQYGIPPHRYIVGRRLELARHLLLQEVPAARAAAMSGFFDQAHLTRHFARYFGITPARYQRSAA